MKDTFKDIGKSNNIKNKLDKAIDNMDMPEIEKQLDKLSADKPFPYEIEDSKIFAKKIIKQNKKGYDTMKNNYKKFTTLAASLILTITIGITAAYATGLFQEFNFFNRDTTVKVRSNQDIREDEAKRLASEASDAYNTPSATKKSSREVDIKTFSNIQEVKEALDIDIVLPSYIPEDFVIDDNIRVENLYDKNFNIYTTYTSKENKERLFGVTVMTNNLSGDMTSITVTDAVYKDTYTTPDGTKYTLLEEDGTTIAEVSINNIDYALIFSGISDDEMNKIIDSVDLNTYTK
ncbi:DUF4367 domain-containing protein [Maledivibacter halophilus]|uniref:DUF4367 domain-containing protein n=1 Tax=Maledivibacter halophilus TaxID=36842 RepID=A0A1T5M962_9FIRM|nr:DUF4367 domain-containing protein [Maledivibacter halophilus]SKC84781.1 protein of unknown function [Maledivibacter halophilus]